MRLLIVGTLKGQLTTATKIAMDNGASVTHAEAIEQAMRGAARRQGRRPAAGRRRARHPRPGDAAGSRTHPRADRGLRHLQRRPRRGRRHPCRRQGIHPAAARSGTDRRGACRRRQQFTRPGLSRRSDGQGHQAGAADRGLRRLRHDHRRIRHRQGSAGALCPHPLGPRQEAVHRDQLRRDPRASAGIRTVRPRKGRVHRRGGAPDRKIRGGHRRHAAARRNLRNGRAAAIEIAARDPGARHRSRRRHQAGAGRYPHHRNLEPQSGGRGARGHLPRGSAVPPQRRQPEDPAACAIVRPTFSNWRSISPRNMPTPTACRCGRSPPMRGGC